MKKLHFILSAFCVPLSCSLSAQLFESFTDGDFSANPTWGGTTITWAVVPISDASTNVSTSNTLRLAATGGVGTDYLSTQIGFWGTDQEWGFWLGRRAQEATVADRAFFWLYANEANVTSSTVDGYRIRYGDDTGNDEIVLESVTNGVGTVILTSSGSVLNAIEDYGFLVRISRSSTGLFTLYTSALPQATGTGAVASVDPKTAAVLQGSVTNTDFTSFNNGYIAVVGAHSAPGPARQALEFDQIRFSPFTALPVKFANVKASKKASGIEVSFSNLTERDVVNYSIERSENGEHFLSIKELSPVKNDGGNADYSLTDAQPLTGNNIYRIKSVETNSKVSYSANVRVDLNAKGLALIITPNPSKPTELGLQITNLPAGTYKIRIFTNSVQIVCEHSLKHNGGSFSQTLPLNNLQSGMYYIELNGSVKFQKQFIVQ